MDNELIFGLAPHHYHDIEKVCSRFPKINKILLFGSRAKGTARQGSDFDLAVFAPSMTSSEFNQLWNALAALPLIFKLDILHWDTLEQANLKDKILQEGKVFYPR
jgi:proline iminopeptidase